MWLLPAQLNDPALFTVLFFSFCKQQLRLDKLPEPPPTHTHSHVSQLHSGDTSRLLEGLLHC